MLWVEGSTDVENNNNACRGCRSNECASFLQSGVNCANARLSFFVERLGDVICVISQLIRTIAVITALPHITNSGPPFKETVGNCSKDGFYVQNYKA